MHAIYPDKSIYLKILMGRKSLNPQAVTFDGSFLIFSVAMQWFCLLQHFFLRIISVKLYNYSNSNEKKKKNTSFMGK